jgi:hypothetical protein
MIWLPQGTYLALVNGNLAHQGMLIAAFTAITTMKSVSSSVAGCRSTPPVRRN